MKQTAHQFYWFKVKVLKDIKANQFATCYIKAGSEVYVTKEGTVIKVIEPNKGLINRIDERQAKDHLQYMKHKGGYLLGHTTSLNDRYNDIWIALVH